MFRRTFYVLFLLLLIALPSEGLAARLFISPSSGSYKVGDTITAKVLVTSDVSMNAVSAHLSFTPALLSAQSVSKANSILTFWVSDPTFSQSNGSVDMEGVSLSGYQGSSGTVATVTFKARRAGTATISFQAGQVLANDGQGTDITAGLGGATYTISDAETKPPTPEPTQAPEPDPAPEETPDITITSFTHPDQNTWYARQDGSFAWNIGQGVTATRILLDTKKTSKPTQLYDGALISKNISDLPEGTSYFHVQLKDADTWGDVAHFAIHVDTVAPVVTQFEELPRTDQTDPRVRVYAKATDSTSGIEKYEISIDGKVPEVFTDVSAGLYSIHVPVGYHTVVLTAYDKAHNTSTKTITIGVTSLATPEITDLLEVVAVGEGFDVRGKGVPKANVSVYFVPKKIVGKSPLQTLLGQPDAELFALSGKIDANGIFSLHADKAPSPDTYKVYAMVTDERGAESEPSEAKSFAVSRPGYILIGEYAISLLSIIAPLVALVALLVISVLGLFTYIGRFRKSLKGEVEDVDKVLTKAMNTLKRDVEGKLSDLKKKTGSKELRSAEERMLNAIEKDLDETEGFIRKEVRDVKRLLNMKRGGEGSTKLDVREE